MDDKMLLYDHTVLVSKAVQAVRAAEAVQQKKGQLCGNTPPVATQ